MDRDTEILDIYHRNIDKAEKIHLLEELALDMRNELEAEDQNMHPDVYNALSLSLIHI